MIPEFKKERERAGITVYNVIELLWALTQFMQSPLHTAWHIEGVIIIITVIRWIKTEIAGLVNFVLRTLTLKF